MNSLLQLLPTMLRLSGDNEQVREQAVFSAWRGVTNNQLSKACVPFHLFGKTLVIATRDKTWKTQLERDAPGWIFKLNSLFGAPLVTFIEFRVDRAAVERARPKPDDSMDVGSVQESREYLMPAAMHIEDEALRETFLRAASKCLAMKKDR